MTNASRPRRVLAAVEMNDIGESATRWAHALASSLGIELLVAAAFENPSSEKPPGAEESFLDEAGRRLAAWVAGFGLGDIQTISLAPDLHDQVARSSRRDDIVVVGVHAKEGATSWALGCAPHEYAQDLECPLVMVPAHAPVREDAGLLVGVDGTPANEVVVDWAKHLASATQRPLQAVYATDPMYDTFDNAGNYGKEERRARAEAEEAFVEFHERSGRPDQVLGDIARDQSVYLTIVGTREHHSFGGLFTGHVIDRLMHEVQSPLALVTHQYIQSAGSR